MYYRTDLAIESRNIIDENNDSISQIDGIDLQQVEYDNDITVTHINIYNESGAKKMNKPCGNYITIEAKNIFSETHEIKESLANIIADEINSIIAIKPPFSVLIAGLGNSNVTPDALGPRTAEKINVTRHLYQIFESDVLDNMPCVSCIIPGVTATTGLETAEFIKSAVELAKADVLIVIDALAAKNIERVSTTIQITDTGIMPGAGMNNKRQQIDADGMGVKVIAIGVPTVIDITTIIRDVLSDVNQGEEEIESYIETYNQEMVVTSTDIDIIIKEFSDIISLSINKLLNTDIYS